MEYILTHSSLTCVQNSCLLSIQNKNTEQQQHDLKGPQKKYNDKQAL